MKFRVTIHAFLSLVFLSLGFSPVLKAQNDSIDNMGLDKTIQGFVDLATATSDTQDLSKAYTSINETLDAHLVTLAKAQAQNDTLSIESAEMDAILMALKMEIDTTKRKEVNSIAEYNNAAYEKYINSKLSRYIESRAAAQKDSSESVTTQDSSWIASQLQMISKVYEENLNRINAKKEQTTTASSDAPRIPPFIQQRNRLNSELSSAVNSALKQSDSVLTDEEFENKQGFIKWPLANSTIKYQYGENEHKGRSSTFINQGIDFASSDNNLITCVHGGIVTKLIDANDGTQSIVVKHSPSYISTYSNVKIGNVQRGDSVKAGQVIGICASTDGVFQVYFQIWKGSKSQNPRHWLKNK
ncbi:MAG: M23 family metallopeptidase [Saprospiraceae bacterium]|nr:M23 family metallopeptidase [Saprospiraceae bacterium]